MLNYANISEFIQIWDAKQMDRGMVVVQGKSSHKSAISIEY